VKAKYWIQSTVVIYVSQRKARDDVRNMFSLRIRFNVVSQRFIAIVRSAVQGQTPAESD